MKCLGCGRQITDESRFCPYCGHVIPGPEGTPQHLAAQLTAKTGMSTALIVILVVAVVIIVVAAVIGALWLLSVAPDEPDLRENLLLYHDEGWDWDDGYVLIEGTVYNYGDAGCFATLHCTISDGRGWSISPTIELSWVGPNGGHVYVEEGYSWPYYYNNQYADGDTLSWTLHFTYTM